MMRYLLGLIFTCLIPFVFCNETEKIEVEEILSSVLKTNVTFYNLTSMHSPLSPDRNKSRVLFYVDGEETLRSAVLSGYRSNALGDRIVNVSGLFENQRTFDVKVAPLLAKLINETGDSRFWVKPYGNKGYVLVYEDAFKERNFRFISKRLLNFKECEMVLKTLAKFHAMTAVLYERGDTKKDFDLSLFERNLPRIKNFHDVQVEKFIESIEKAWMPEWSNASNYVRLRLKNMTEQMKSFHRKSEKSFNVLNIGNVQADIVLFKFDEETGTPISVLLTPSMNYYYNTPAFDLLTFLWNGPNYTLMFDKRDEFVTIYHTQLIEELKKYGYKGRNTPPPDLEYIKNEMERLKNFGLYNSIASLQYIVKDHPQEIKFTKVIEEAWSKDTVIVIKEPLYGENFISIMKKILNHEMKSNPL